MLDLTKMNDKSFWRLGLTLAISVLSSILVGCFYGFEHRDVLTNREEYWGGFPPGQVYELVQDAFCTKDAFHSGLFLSGHYDSEKYHRTFTVKQYRGAGINEDVQVVPSGTRIRTSKILGYRSASRIFITVFGAILDGSLAGKEVDFGSLATADEDLPRGAPYIWTLKPRAEFLKVVSPTDRTTAPK